MPFYNKIIIFHKHIDLVPKNKNNLVRTSNEKHVSQV